jgi:predicted RNA methylase
MNTLFIRKSVEKFVNKNKRRDIMEKCTGTMKSTQNKSHAVMAQRSEAGDSLDDFPTPPWATRSLIEYVVESPKDLASQSCLEPACGEGHMAKVLAEYFGHVAACDIHPYGFGEVIDFMSYPIEVDSFDWVITNPPFRLGEDFILKALATARIGVAMLTRTVFIESVGRYSRLFNVTPPTKFAQFVERVPMVKGRLDPKASTATGYCWLVWEKNKKSQTRLVWIPPCRKSLEREGDYQVPPKRSATTMPTFNPKIA